MPKKTGILVVDDNEEFGRNVKDVLELKDYQVAIAGDGFQALQMVKQGDFALALMDVRMPVIDGVETFMRLKEMAPALSVIMLSAFAVEDRIKEALRAGAFGFLRKPLDFDKLFELIEPAISRQTRIQVVDDDATLCANMEDVLSAKGYRVSVACDGSTAIEKAWESKFNIMVLDLKLPPLNGLETYRFIRDFRPDVAVIIITGYSREMGNLLAQARQEGVYACLEKPINIDALVALLAQIESEKTRGISPRLNLKGI